MAQRAHGDRDSSKLSSTAWQQMSSALTALHEVPPSTTGEELRRQLVQRLAEAWGCQATLLSEVHEDANGVPICKLTVHSRTATEVLEAPLAGSPCEDAVRDGWLQVDHDLCSKYPEDLMLLDLNVQSCYGVALKGDDGRSVGQIAILDDRPLLDIASIRAVLEIFALRASVDMHRRAADNRLRDLEDNFKILFERSPCAIVLFDPDTWKPEEFNDQAAEMMGYSRAEFAQLTISDLEMVPNPSQTSSHVDAILESGGDEFEALHKAKDGSPRHVIVSLRITEWKGRKMMITLWHDITARKAAEQAHESSERRLQSIFDSAMDAVVILDESFVITRLNPAAERVFKCSASELLGQEAQTFFPGAEAVRVFSSARLVDAQGGTKSVWAPEGLSARRPGGGTFPVELTLSPFEVDGEPSYTLILRDVNDRRRAEKELSRLREDKQLLQEQLSQHTTIVGDSPAMAGVLSHVEKVAATDSTVLILGETGTGKELIARAIHEQSVRHDRIMVTVNCAALPKDLLESELFGHEKGAFTGATHRKRGRFELASGGTLFLDEVGELSAEAQAKLLRALQEGEIQRLGGETTVRVNVRIVAATHRDLSEMVKQQLFRSDLYYRLSVFPLRVPPLRERRSDIPQLVEHFLCDFSGKFGKRLSHFDDASMQKLLAHEWGGNIRELQNIIERSAILCGGPELTLEAGLLSVSTEKGGHDDLDDVTRQHMRRVLADCNWVVEGPRGAALRLGLKPATLRFRMKKLGIQRES